MTQDDNQPLWTRMERIEEKLDRLISDLPSNYPAIADYERRVSAAELRIQALENAYTTNRQWENDTHREMELHFAAEGDKTREKIDEVRTDINKTMITILVQFAFTAIGIGASIIIPILLHK